VAFLQHTVLFFWNRYEVPELARQRQQGHGVNTPQQAAQITSAHLTMFDSLGTFTTLSANAVVGTRGPVTRAPPPAAPGGAPSVDVPGNGSSGSAPEGGEHRRQGDEAGVIRQEERVSNLSRGSGLSGLGSIYASLLSGSSDDLAAMARASERRSSGTFASDGTRRESEGVSENGRLPVEVTANVNPMSNGVQSGLPWVLGGSQGPLMSWLPVFREQDRGSERGSATDEPTRGDTGSESTQSRGREEAGLAPFDAGNLELPRVVEEPGREDAMRGVLGSPTDPNSNDWGLRRRDHHRGRHWRSWGEM
jgi:hypothetical protein